MGTQTLRRCLVGGLTAILLAAGCASMRPPVTAPSPQPQPSPPLPVSAPTPAPAPAPVPTPAPAAAPEPAPATVPAPASAAPAESPAKTKSPPPRSPNKSASVAATKPQPVAAPPVAAPAAPTLDLASLEQRLRDTKAIGVFTKLSLKNQVDDLLRDFRALYKRAKPPPGPEFRQRYDLLLLKVLSLLQDGDPPLAAAISSSKEAIWNILADPDKLAKI
jgi:outer membrane biosynthesis protein TonB